MTGKKHNEVRICDLMYKGVVCCNLRDTAREVAKIMAFHKIRSVIVVDEHAEVWGHIYIMDLISHYGENLDEIIAEDIMRPYKIDVDPLSPIKDVIELIIKYNRLIIIDPNAGPKMPVAMITSYDIVQYLSGLNTGTHCHTIKLRHTHNRQEHKVQHHPRGK